jgi:hypothetical protein
MQFILAPVLLFAAATCQGADDASSGDDAPKASRIVDGMALPFDPKGVADGVTATLALLESCHSEAWPGKNPPTDEDVKKVLLKDHVRLVFAKPITARVMNEEVEFSELVFGAGAFWLRSGDKVRRYAKYEYEKYKPFQEWHRQTPPAK